jgi:multicomponent Na+:H+ antiporter subunit G
MTAEQWITLTIAAIGTLFMLISALGILRLPDVYTRMHAAGKAATLGISCVLLSVGLYHYETGQLIHVIALILLFFITGPIAVTTMARAAYRSLPAKNLQLHHDDIARLSRRHSPASSREELRADPPA